MALIQPGLTQAESDLLQHVSMWGSDGYPIRKIGRHWQWMEAYGVKGAPGVYKTKREAFAAFERWMAFKAEQAGAAAKELALAELARRRAEG